jgi:hypothetical protein
MKWQCSSSAENVRSAQCCNWYADMEQWSGLRPIVNSAMQDTIVLRCTLQVDRFRCRTENVRCAGPNESRDRVHNRYRCAAHAISLIDLVSQLHSIYTEESQPFDFSFPRSMDFTAWGSRFSGILALNAFVALAQRNWPVLSMAPQMSGRHLLIVSQWISC